MKFHCTKEWYISLDCLNKQKSSTDLGLTNLLTLHNQTRYAFQVSLISLFVQLDHPYQL